MEGEHDFDADAVAYALSRCEWELGQPGRYMHPDHEAYSWDIPDARDTLDEAMGLLPRGARRDLGRLVQRIDTEFERRTLPNPHHVSEWSAHRWWRCRI